MAAGIVRAGPLDEFVPTLPTLEDLNGRRVSLAKLEDGGGIQVGEEHLHQLRSRPELFTGTSLHGCYFALLSVCLFSCCL